MNGAHRPTWTLESFLAWEERQELRYEFDGVAPIAQTGVTVAHDTIQINIILALGSRLRGKPCRVRGDSLKIQVMGSIRYPDAFITCTPTQPGSTMAAAPVVVFEVLSKSTSRTDRLVKRREYGATASIRRYVVIQQSAIAGTMSVKAADADEWLEQALDASSVLLMPEIDVELPFAELYDGLDLPTTDPDESAA